MDEVINIDWQNMPREELKKLIMKSFGFNETEANFHIALARGEKRGDIISIDENDTPRPY